MCMPNLAFTFQRVEPRPHPMFLPWASVIEPLCCNQHLVNDAMEMTFLCATSIMCAPKKKTNRRRGTPHYTTSMMPQLHEMTTNHQKLRRVEGVSPIRTTTES